jgi:ABC-type nitrate/sulfonate/bicarbonate transport system substrate-binding protein
VNVAAVSGGSADIMHGSMISAWTAIGRGARIRTVMSHVANPYRLVTAPEIASCAALSGRLLALAVESSVSTHLVRAFINEECPAIRPDTLFVAESSNRAAAFLAGGVAAVALDLSSLLWLQREAPGRLRIMSDFSSRWPGIKTTGVHVNIEFARDHPEMLIDYIRALLAANRDVATAPSLLTATASEKMGKSGDWATTAQAYLAAGVWPANGGLTSEDVESTLTFFKNHSHLDQRLTKESVTDLKFLEAALADVRE